MQRVDGFLSNQAMRGLSRATIRRRGWTLRTFFVDPVWPDTATTDDVEAFLAARPSSATRRALLGDIRAFFRWAQSRELIRYDPTAPIETPKVPKRMPTPWTYDELSRAWHAADFQMRLIITLGAAHGLRVSEMANLHTNDIDVDQRTLWVRNGKGGKDRVVPLARHLEAMMEFVPPGSVLPYTNGGSISNAVRGFARPLGIVRRAHDLRASYATELARVSGGDMVLVARLLGHESMDTTQRYVRMIPAGASAVALMWPAEEAA